VVVLVITLKGWKESVGVKAEMEIAKKYGVPIEFIDPEPYISLRKFSNPPKSDSGMEEIEENKHE